MKLLLVTILAVAAVDARSFIPKKFVEETFFDKTNKYYPTEFDVEGNNDVNNEIFPVVSDVDVNKPYYYRYFFPTTYKKYTPFYKPTTSNEETNKFFYDPKEKYDYDTFVKYFTSNPVLATLAKYFPTVNKAVENGKNTEEYKYYPVPKEVVELAKTTKDLKETLRTLVKYYYNLPNDVKATVVEKYDFENVVRFLLQVYYDIPNVPHGLTTYYDIPTAVVAELKTQYDLKKVIATVISKYLELTPFERDYYTERYFNVPAVVRTLIKVYYGVPQFEKYEVEDYYYDAEFVRKFAVEFVKKYDYVEVVDTVFDRRSQLTENEKEIYDKFFSVEEYVKFLVRAYYYGTFETTKPFETSTYYTKQGFFGFLNKVYNYYNGYYNKDTAEDNAYPLEYYFNVIFGKKNFVPTGKGFPFSDYYFGGKYDGFKGFFDYFFGGYFPYTGVTRRSFGPYANTYGYPTEYYPRASNYFYPEGFNGQYYGVDGKDFYGDYYYPGYGKYFFGKKTFGFPYNFYPRNYYGVTPRAYYLNKVFGFDKFNPFTTEGNDYFYGKNVYDTDKYFGNKFTYPANYIPEYFYEKFQGKDFTPKTYTPFEKYGYKYDTYSPVNFEKYFGGKQVPYPRTYTPEYVEKYYGDVTPRTYTPFDKYFGKKYDIDTPFTFEKYFGNDQYVSPTYTPEKFFEKYFNNKVFNTEEY